MDRKTTAYSFRIYEDTFVRLNEIASANGEKLAVFLNRELEKLVACFNVIRSPDKPTPEEYAACCDLLESKFRKLKDGWLVGSEKVRARTKFDRWVAHVAGEIRATRTTADWRRLFGRFEFTPTEKDLQARNSRETPEEAAELRGLYNLAQEINAVYLEWDRHQQEVKAIKRDADPEQPAPKPVIRVPVGTPEPRIFPATGEQQDGDETFDDLLGSDNV